jgi:hypothetical protein
VIRALLNWLKWRIAADELRELERYRTACCEARRWLGRLPMAADVAEWIQHSGNGWCRPEIAMLRARLERMEQGK